MLDRKQLWLPAAMASLVSATVANQARAQATLSAGDVSIAAVQTAAVPITLVAGSAQVAYFGVTFTVVAQGGAPAITGKLSYMANTPPGAPQLSANTTDSFAIGYVSAIDPPLTGTVRIGTLLVPIKPGATATYQVQVLRISAADPIFDPVDITGQSGTITIVGGPLPSPVDTPTPTPTRTATPTPTPSNTPTPTPTPCLGACRGGGPVTVDELLTMVNIALGTVPVSTCAAGDPNHDGQITIDELLAAVSNALSGCGSAA